MTIRKNGAAWGSVVGIVFGIVGIGIPLPGTALAEWQWLHPVGFYTVSIVLLGSLGMVLGWLFDHLIRRSPHNVMLGVPLALALAVASVSLYRSQAALRQAFWQSPGVGLAEVTGIQGDLQPGRPARDYRQAGTLMGGIWRRYGRSRANGAVIGGCRELQSFSGRVSSGWIETSEEPRFRECGCGAKALPHGLVSYRAGSGARPRRGNQSGSHRPGDATNGPAPALS